MHCGSTNQFEYFLNTLWNTQKVVVFFECEKNIIASTMSSGKLSKTHCLLHHCFWPAWRVWGLGCYFPSRPPPPHTQTMLRFRKFEAISNPCLAAAPGRPFIGSSPVLAPVLRRWLGHRFDWFMMTKHNFPGLAVELARWMSFWECEWRFVLLQLVWSRWVDSLCWAVRRVSWHVQAMKKITTYFWSTKKTAQLHVP